ncbi:hypothetical protein L873DRAFT_1819516, partial [Choiromyces venosus 120613-1]
MYCAIYLFFKSASSTNDRSEIPLPTSIDQPTVARVHAQDLSSKHSGTAAIAGMQVDSPTVAAVQAGDPSSAPAGIPLTTRIISPPSAAVQVEDLSSANLGTLLPMGIQIDPPVVPAIHEQDHWSINVHIRIQAPLYMVTRLQRWARLGTHVFNLRYPLGMAFTLVCGGFHLSDWPFEQFTAKCRPALNKICHFSCMCFFVLVLDAIISGLSWYVGRHVRFIYGPEEEEGSAGAPRIS